MATPETITDRLPLGMAELLEGADYVLVYRRPNGGWSVCSSMGENTAALLTAIAPTLTGDSYRAVPRPRPQ